MKVRGLITLLLMCVVVVSAQVGAAAALPSHQRHEIARH